MKETNISYHQIEAKCSYLLTGPIIHGAAILPSNSGAPSI
jgi:hypothetical protein